LPCRRTRPAEQRWCCVPPSCRAGSAKTNYRYMVATRKTCITVDPLARYFPQLLHTACQPLAEWTREHSRPEAHSRVWHHSDPDQSGVKLSPAPTSEWHNMGHCKTGPSGGVVIWSAEGQKKQHRNDTRPVMAAAGQRLAKAMAEDISHTHTRAPDHRYTCEGRKPTYLRRGGTQSTRAPLPTRLG
jgi:hypothetical protein